MTRLIRFTFGLSLSLLPALAQKPAHSKVPGSPPQTPAPEAAEWWRLTTALSNDAMQGRDTGSPAYEQAAKFVADQFKSSGLKPAGDNGTYLQEVPMQQAALLEDKSSITILHPGAPDTELHFNTDVTTSARAALAVESAPLVFAGYGLSASAMDLKGSIAVVFNGIPAGLSPQERESYPMRRLRALTQAGVVAILSIDNLGSIEPPHWPAAYSRSVVLAGTPAVAPGPPVIRLNPESFPALFEADVAAQRPAQALLAEGGEGAPLPMFALGSRARIRMTVEQKDVSSPNILAILPGSDPKLAPELVAVSAHLDGYGFGTPVLGDNLYNGTLDDAAYVATLLEMAHDLARQPKEIPARSLLFCIFTGEEKGLLGSQYFIQHPTVPLANVVADFNLDQLRPIFPLKILTMEGIADSTLGDTARSVAQRFNIELRTDRETERNLFRRADNYSFVRAGIPIASFIFGYDPGTEEERIYRDWYARRYHKPQDDLNTPIHWAAAVTFNRFYRALVLAVANGPNRPAWLPNSPYAPKP